MMRNNHEPKSDHKYRFLPPLLLIAAAIALSAAARIVPGFAEWYSTHIYPVLQGTLGRLSGLFPFSIAELLCLLIPVCIVIDVIVHRHRFRAVLHHLLLLFSVLFFLYAANCGVNYYRNTFVSAEIYAGADQRISADLLDEFCVYTVEKLNESSDGLDSDGHKGAEGIYPNKKDLAAAAIAAMQGLGEENDSLSGYYPIPKELTVLSRFFSNMGVTGVYSPFTVEANINGEMPDFDRPFTACHELSHLRGYMNEGEANYIGWLACIGSSDASFNRSGWIYAWIYAGRTLRRVDPERFDELRNALPADVIAELEANNEFWATHKTKASDVQNQVNDAYLKANGQELGIASYDQLTVLMLLWYLQSQ